MRWIFKQTYADSEERPLKGRRKAMLVPDDLPQMPIRVAKISHMATPECVLGWFNDPCPGSHCGIHGLSDFSRRVMLCPNVRAVGPTGWTAIRYCRQCQPRPRGPASTRQTGQEHHGTMLELLIDALGRQPKSVTVERKRSVKIDCGKCQNRGSGFHSMPFLSAPAPSRSLDNLGPLPCSKRARK
jgi:hypothetical protein